MLWYYEPADVEPAPCQKGCQSCCQSAFLTSFDSVLTELSKAVKSCQSLSKQHFDRFWQLCQNVVKSCQTDFDSPVKKLSNQVLTAFDSAVKSCQSLSKTVKSCQNRFWQKKFWQEAAREIQVPRTVKKLSNSLTKVWQDFDKVLTEGRSGHADRFAGGALRCV